MAGTVGGSYPGLKREKRLGEKRELALAELCFFLLPVV